jgi:hypothetical protein
MSDWDAFPMSYRSREIEAIERATHAGENVSVIGLGGAGKSNLLGFLAHRRSNTDYPYILADCNRLLSHTPSALFHLLLKALGQGVSSPSVDESRTGLEKLTEAIESRLQEANVLVFLIDRFDVFTGAPNEPLFNRLRALRDSYKYRLVYVLATRRPLPADNELVELFHAHTIWLGPLSEADAAWNVDRYAGRVGLSWAEPVKETLIEKSLGYPSLLRGFCEAYASGAELKELSAHPAVRDRVADILSDNPDEQALRQSGLAPLTLPAGSQRVAIDAEQLTLKEQRLYAYLLAHPNRLCDKDELIQAVWPEDAVFEHGVRDSSLAQLIRRLRLKIELDPSDPQLIQTVPGRGYVFRA